MLNSNFDVLFEWFRRDNMETMDIHPEVLEKIFNQEEVPVIVLKEFEIDTNVNGHHVYKDLWTPEIGENLDVQIKSNNLADKYAAWTRKSGKVVGHL